MTRQQIASMTVHPVDNPQNSLITLSDLRGAARSCGFITDPYSTLIISITHTERTVNDVEGGSPRPFLDSCGTNSEPRGLPMYSEVLEPSDKWNDPPPNYENVMKDHENK